MVTVFLRQMANHSNWTKTPLFVSIHEIISLIGGFLLQQIIPVDTMNVQNKLPNGEIKKLMSWFLTDFQGISTAWKVSQTISICRIAKQTSPTKLLPWHWAKTSVNAGNLDCYLCSDLFMFMRLLLTCASFNLLQLHLFYLKLEYCMCFCVFFRN